MKSHKPELTQKPMATVEYTRPVAPIVSLEERKRQRSTLKRYNAYDGGDDAS